VKYKGIKLDCGYRIDLFVNDELIVELKSVDKIMGIHRAQLLSNYLKTHNLADNICVGLLKGYTDAKKT
jgi:GxxExxY protein